VQERVPAQTVEVGSGWPDGAEDPRAVGAHFRAGSAGCDFSCGGVGSRSVRRRDSGRARVVKEVVRNLYEPLRLSLGTFVVEISAWRTSIVNS
jgi:hypothetical protein